jgi:hypothetical protein
MKRTRKMNSRYFGEEWCDPESEKVARETVKVKNAKPVSKCIHYNVTSISI